MLPRSILNKFLRELRTIVSESKYRILSISLHNSAIFILNHVAIVTQFTRGNPLNSPRSTFTKRILQCLIFFTEFIFSILASDKPEWIITNSISRQNLIDTVKNFQEDLLNIPLENMKVTCSIGIAQIHNEKKFEEIYEKADEMLYKVKSEGRNGYAIYTDE